MPPASRRYSAAPRCRSSRTSTQRTGGPLPPGPRRPPAGGNGAERADLYCGGGGQHRHHQLHGHEPGARRHGDVRAGGQVDQGAPNRTTIADTVSVTSSIADPTTANNAATVSAPVSAK